MKQNLLVPKIQKLPKFLHGKIFGERLFFFLSISCRLKKVT